MQCNSYSVTYRTSVSIIINLEFPTLFLQNQSNCLSNLQIQFSLSPSLPHNHKSQVSLIWTFWHHTFLGSFFFNSSGFSFEIEKKIECRANVATKPNVCFIINKLVFMTDLSDRLTYFSQLTVRVNFVYIRLNGNIVLSAV